MIQKRIEESIEKEKIKVISELISNDIKPLVNLFSKMGYDVELVGQVLKS